MLRWEQGWYWGTAQRLAWLEHSKPGGEWQNCDQRGVQGRLRKALQATLRAF